MLIQIAQSRLEEIGNDALQYYVGCSGWSYTSWQGQFYPSSIDNSGWLKYYSLVFDSVEIDSSFYRTPTSFTVKNWAKKTPKEFKFTAKFPKVITHDKRLKAVDKELEHFFQAIGPTIQQNTGSFDTTSSFFEDF